MFKHNILIAWRNIQKNIGSSIVNILGFSIGITACLLIYLWIQHELSFDKQFNDSENIYKVVALDLKDGKPIKSIHSANRLAYVLEQTYPFVEKVASISYQDLHPFGYNGKVLEERLILLYPGFFNVFNFEVLEGDPNSIFKSKDGIILSEAFAKKIFGDEKAVGKELVSSPYGKKIVRKVMAVIKVPVNSHFILNAMVSSDDFYVRLGGQYSKQFAWRAGRNVNYVKFQDGFHLSETQKEELANVVRTHSKLSTMLLYEPLENVHLYQDINTEFEKGRTSIWQILVFASQAILILILCVFNFVNLSLAKATSRYKEIALKKISGSSRSRLMLQFILETIFISFVALHLAVLLIELVLPEYNSILQKQLNFNYTIYTFFAFIITSVILGVFVGIYPSLYLSSFKPVQIFQQVNNSRSKSVFIRSLFILQYVISLGLLICTLLMSSQMSFIKNKELGIDVGDVVEVKTNLWYQMEAFQNEIKNSEYILSACGVSNSPDKFWLLEGMFKWRTSEKLDSARFNKSFVDQYFAETFKLKLLKGKFMDTEFAKYWAKQGDQFAYPAVINESAAKLIGEEDIIGMKLNDEYVIVGVVEDFHYQSLHEAIQPLLLEYNPEAIVKMDVRLKEGATKEGLKELKDLYTKHRPQRGFNFVFVKDKLEQLYQTEQSQTRVFTGFSLLSVLISLMGILGLVSYTISKRVKEVGIRKVNGASSTKVMLLFLKEYLINILIASVPAILLSYYYTESWLQNFSYRIEISWILIFSALVIILVLSSLFIALSSLHIARQNPVDSLRYE